MHLRPTILLQAIALLTLAAIPLRAQEIFRRSWTVQDKAHGLQQELARTIIGQANDWLTRDDPYAPTARLDDPLRVTVVGEVDPGTGEVRPRLAQIVMGTVIIETELGGFLDSVTLTRLVRRDYYWRDETLTVFNETLSPLATVVIDSADLRPDPFTLLFGEGARYHFRLGLDESSVRIRPDLYVWGGLGYEEMGLPDFSYGKARLGLAYNGLRIWGELPAPVGNTNSFLLARGLEGSFGLGISFDDSWFGGAVSGSDVKRVIGSAAQENGDDRYYIGKSALLYGTMPIRIAPLGDLRLRAKIGGGYQQISRIDSSEAITGPRGSNEEINRFKLLVRLEFASLDDQNKVHRRIAGEFLGDSFVASYQEQITDIIGIRIVGAAHGLFGDRDPWLPGYSISISPTITIW